MNETRNDIQYMANYGIMLVTDISQYMSLYIPLNYTTVLDIEVIDYRVYRDWFPQD